MFVRADGEAKQTHSVLQTLATSFILLHHIYLKNNDLLDKATRGPTCCLCFRLACLLVCTAC